jgi:hypothetical protein
MIKRESQCGQSTDSGMRHQSAMALVRPVSATPKAIVGGLPKAAQGYCGRINPLPVGSDYARNSIEAAVDSAGLFMNKNIEQPGAAKHMPLGDRRGQGESKSGGNDFLTAISEDLGSGFEEHLEQTKGHVQRF